MLKAEVGETIRKLREAQRLDQDALAKLAKTSRVTISSIENGTSATNLDLLERIAGALGRKPWELLRPDSAEPTARDHDLAECARRVTNAALRAQAAPPVLRDAEPLPTHPAASLAHIPPKAFELLAKIRGPADLKTLLNSLEVLAEDSDGTPPKPAQKPGKAEGA